MLTSTVRAICVNRGPRDQNIVHNCSHSLALDIVALFVPETQAVHAGGSVVGEIALVQLQEARRVIWMYEFPRGNVHHVVGFVSQKILN